MKRYLVSEVRKSPIAIGFGIIAIILGYVAIMGNQDDTLEDEQFQRDVYSKFSEIKFMIGNNSSNADFPLGANQTYEFGDEHHRMVVNALELRYELKHDQALEEYDLIIQEYPYDKETVYSRAYLLLLMGKHDEAIEGFDNTIETIKLDKSVSLAVRGMELIFDERKIEEGLVYVSNATEIDPKNFFGYSLKGSTLVLIGKYEEALVPLDKAIELDPMNSWPIGTKAEALYQLGNYEDAFFWIEKSLQLNPDDTVFLYQKSLTLNALGRNAEALLTIDKLLTITSEFPKAFSFKAYLLSSFGRYDEALESVNKALEIDPNLTVALDEKEKILENLQ